MNPLQQVGQVVLVTGATSGIGAALATRLASQGHRLILAGRDRGELDRLANDLRVRFDAEVHVEPFEASGGCEYDGFWRSCTEVYGRVDGLVTCHGFMADQSRTQDDAELAGRTAEVNYLSCVALFTVAAADFQRAGAGVMCAVTSVAGDRGRQSNYVYGSAKGGLSRFMQGLHHRLHGYGVTVVDVKPGFVDTAMTWGLPGLFLVASPDQVARDIIRGIERGRCVVYTPWFWRFILMVIRHVPTFVFKRTKL